MKKKLFILVFLSLLALPRPVAGLSYAEVSKERRETVQVRLEEHREIMTAKREEFRARLADIRDQRKQTILTRIDNNLARLNQHLTDRMQHHLTILSQLLDKLSDRLAKTKTEGYDTSAAEAAVNAAQEAIDTAEAAVAEQAVKEYVIEFEDETGLRIGASEAKQSLRNDLKTVYQLVKIARQAVVEALETAKEILK